MAKEDALGEIENSHNVYLNWKKTSFNNRAQIINKFASLLIENKDSLAELMSVEMGKLKSEALDEIKLCSMICEYSADSAEKFLKEDKRNFDKGYALVSNEPLGVILSIQPWNFPLYQVIRASVPNIMAGNVSLTKHAQNTWGTAKKIQELFEEANLPKYVFNHLYVEDDILESVIESKFVQGISFTGSKEAGQKVGQKAGYELKKVVLELGGNDPYIVLADADIEKAAKICAKARLGNNGQTCTAAKRFIVVDEVYDEFKKHFIKNFENIKMGNPLDADTQLGPLARKDLLDTLIDQVDESVKLGATILIGGKSPDMKGYFYEPTILENLKPGMPAYDGELFGPVASLIKVSNLSEAIKVANDSEFGLGSGIFTKDIKLAIQTAQNDLITGMTNINGFNLAKPNIPFGGVKNSGYGREHSEHSFKEFTNIKSVLVQES